MVTAWSPSFLSVVEVISLPFLSTYWRTCAICRAFSDCPWLTVCEISLLTRSTFWLTCAMASVWSSFFFATSCVRLFSASPIFRVTSAISVSIR